MLSQLYIENMAVIQKAAIDFSPGLNVFTGETGAGKTILVNSINAVLGGRTYRDIIRSGESKAMVSAVFSDISECNAQRLAELGCEPENGQLVITRELDADGKGACRINGRPAVLSALRAAASLLIDIHGQHDNQELLSAEKHIGFVDGFGGLSPLIEDYSEAYRRMTDISERLSKLHTDEEYKLQRMDILRYQINEIGSAALSEGEDDELERQRGLIRNSEKVTNALNAVTGLLSGGDEGEGISAGLEELRDELAAAAEHIPELAAYNEKLTDVSYLLEDVADTARGYLDDMEFDPRQLDAIESRLDLIHKLKKKYGHTIAEILEHLEKATAELSNLDLSDELSARLSAELAAASAEAEKKAELLTKARVEAAEKFTGQVESELAFLDMASVRMTVSCEKKPLSPNGQDKLEFLISANQGEEPRPLARIASGGELARIMLAIKNVLADRDSLETIIFDEVDAGISGRAAQKIGSKLAQVAESRQVIVVTHLAQVAAYASRHIRIFKTVSDGRTYTHVETLDMEQRKRELARIMVGGNISESALKSAEEMLILSGNCRPSI